MMNKKNEVCCRCGKVMKKTYIFSDDMEYIHEVCEPCWVIGFGQKKDADTDETK